jgi:cytochrome c oxidase subunit II
MAQEETRTEAAEAAEVAAERRPPRRTAAQMIIVGVVASVLGVIAGLLIHWFPPAASTQADKIDTLWDVLIVASVPVFVLVTTVIGFSILNFRMRPGEEGIDGPPIHGNTRLEVIWTAIPATLIVGLVVYAYVVLRDIEKSPALAAGQKERVVQVFGEQFAWTFQYNEGGKRFTSAQLYLPADESVRFDVRSKDVIHDFWVPDFRMKIDAVPGITTHYRVTPKPSAIGEHQIVCAELCGLGHAFMRQTAHVMPGPAFNAWVQRASRQGAAGGGGGAAGGGGPAGAAPDGKALFANGNSGGATACGSCHTLSEASTNGTTGPDLDQVLKGKDAAFIKQSITQPNAEIAKGYTKGIMPPNYESTLKPAELDALVKFLSDATK